MKSRILLRVLSGAVAAAICDYAGLHVYGHADMQARLQRPISAIRQKLLHVASVPRPILSFCTPGTLLDLRWSHAFNRVKLDSGGREPNGVFRTQAFYFEFDVNRQLIRKTHYEHLDETYLRWQERFKESIKSTQEAGLDWSSTETEQFRAAKVVVLVHLVEPPQVDPEDSSWDPLSNFLVVRSWKARSPRPLPSLLQQRQSALD
jgi:hypothetical protein